MSDPNLSSRERIALAARTEFSAYGYAGARVARIADQASVNKQLIFYYYKNKAGLYDAVSVAAGDLGSDDAEPSDAGGDSPTDHLRRAVDRMFASLAARPDAVALLLEHHHRGGVASKVARRAATRLVAQTSAVVSRGQGVGYFRDDVEPELIARQALTLCVGYLALAPLFGDNEGAREEWVAAAAELLHRGVAW